MTTILLFEDPRVTDIYPITVGRPAFAINCGGYRLIDQVLRLETPVAAAVRPHLRDLVANDFPKILSPQQQTGPTLLVNARLVPSLSVHRELARILRAGRPGVVRHSEDTVAAALLPEGGADLPLDLDTGPLAKIINELPLDPLPAELPVLEFSHDVVRHHMTTISENAEQQLRNGDFQEVADGVFAADGARLGANVVSDSSKGPILLQAGASVGPFSFLQGPAIIGEHARVLEHAAIKDGVVLGHTTKIGGEVEASIIEPYTNKQHHGFLGHSYLGSWINLGAGTCNSDLKNTYGTVNMRYARGKVPTGMQFVGAFIGDYSKSAINTGIFTGKTIGVCSMVYGFVTTNVPSFVNYARLFGQVTATPVEVMVATQARMFARRDVVQRPCDIQLLHDMYDLTRAERELGSVPPEPLSL